LITILVCGSRIKNYRQTRERYSNFVEYTLNIELFKIAKKKNIKIINGGCYNSADEFSTKYCLKNNIENNVIAGRKGTYLFRNIEMVKKSDYIFAFWDGFSYGTAHTISQAVLNKKKIKIFKV
jgi:hypothetical protein